MPTPRHVWIRGRCRADRLRLLATMAIGRDVPPMLAVVDAHRRLRGPYTAAGALLRQLVPGAVPRWPMLVMRHSVEILAAAPDLFTEAPAASAAAGARFHPPSRTLRLAHGIAEFLRDLQRVQHSTATVVFENAVHADPTDVELITVLLRRVDPAVLTVVVGTGREPLPESLATALDEHCVAADARPGTLAPTVGDPAARFVAADGVSDDEGLREGYVRATRERRAQLHDLRADQLAALGDRALHLGALPWHREHGVDPGGAGSDALRAAAEHCVAMGFHDAAAELALRGRAITDPRRRPEQWWALTTTITTALGALGRLDKREAWSQHLMADRHDRIAQRQLAYLAAVRDLGRLDGHGVSAWIVGAAQFTGPEAAGVVDVGASAVGDLYRRDPDRLLDLVDDALAMLRPDAAAALRGALLASRAEANAALRDWEAALYDRTAAIDEEPTHPEHHADRAAVLRILGRTADALADLDRAVALSPPFAGLRLARAEARREAGELDGAIADVDYALELVPQHLGALAARARLLQAANRHREAVDAFDAVLAVVDDQDARRGRELSLRRLAAPTDGPFVDVPSVIDG